MKKWMPIETSPMDKLILIREGRHSPDLVRWEMKRPEKKVGGNTIMERPAGWFRPSGGRSHVLNPTEWLDIPS